MDRPIGATLPGTPGARPAATARNATPATPRRTILRWLGAATLAAAPAARAAQSLACMRRPPQTEGPFYVEEDRLVRSDIRSDPASGRVSVGVSLALAIAVTQVRGAGCLPLAGARVGLWQCDAAGRYSDVRGFGGSTVGQKFLRGYQDSDVDGLARFVTIVPGWYPGRAVHIHLRVDAPAGAAGTRTFVSQLYFDDAFVDAVHREAAYRDRRGARTRNAEDGIFMQGGERLLLAPQREGEGFGARFDVAIA